MKLKSLFALLCCIVFALTSLSVAVGSESKQAPDKAVESSVQPGDSKGSDSEATPKKDCKDTKKNPEKSGSEEGVTITPPAPIIPRIAPDEGC